MNRRRYPCTHKGCPAIFVEQDSRDKHAKIPHIRCSHCGRNFQAKNGGLTKHLAHVKRRFERSFPKEL